MNSGTQTWNPASTRDAHWPAGGGFRHALEALLKPLRPDDVKLRVEPSPVPRLRIEGALTRHTAAAVKQAAREMVGRPAGLWQIDLSRITRWDAEGLATLVHALDLSEINGSELQLVAPPVGLRDVLEKAQLHRLFWIVDESHHD
jgi:ABC-type transporter Mla MlaB component